MATTGTKAKILTGARAKVIVREQVVGLFSNCTWSVQQDKVPNFILGQYGPVEITPTSQEAVSINLRGYRVIDAGPYAVGATKLADLLTETDFTVQILDRQPDDTGKKDKVIFSAVGCRVLGWSSGVAAKGVSDIELRVLGLRAGDESKGSDSPETGVPTF